MTPAQDQHAGEPPGPAELSDWITTDEAAALAHVEPDTLRHYARHGQAPGPQKFGRSLVWSRRSILTWLQSRPGQGARTDLRDPMMAAPSRTSLGPY